MVETSPSTRGRILAALHLFVIIAGITGQAFVSNRLVVGNDATKTAVNILANKSLYRVGFTIFMLEMVAHDLLMPALAANLDLAVKWLNS